MKKNSKRLTSVDPFSFLAAQAANAALAKAGSRARKKPGVESSFVSSLNEYVTTRQVLKRRRFTEALAGMPRIEVLQLIGVGGRNITRLIPRKIRRQMAWFSARTNWKVVA